MDRETLLKEHKDLVCSLLDATKFIYSERFYALNELERQKFIRNKAATEAHLSSLSALLWCEEAQKTSLPDIMTMGLIGSLLGTPNRP
ncbi:MAG: hypothetical protein IJ680_07645 [Paludibacteraceae bacterium]|nr:hypothetical protein [Paludibacteraceae bacterium]